MMGAWEKIVPELERLSGDTGVYLCNLVTGDMRAYAADKPVVAASVIKIPVMIEVFRQARDGLLDLNEIHRLSDDERLPSCGTLKAMHTGIEMTLLDLTRLMVIVSDNAAKRARPSVWRCWPPLSAACSPPSRCSCCLSR